MLSVAGEYLRHVGSSAASVDDTVVAKDVVVFTAIPVVSSAVVVAVLVAVGVVVIISPLGTTVVPAVSCLSLIHI